MGEVWLGGRRRRIAGRVAMDQFVVDCGDDEVAAGDEVILFGPGDRGEPTANEWADGLRHHRLRDRHPDRSAGAAPVRRPGRIERLHRAVDFDRPDRGSPMSTVGKILGAAGIATGVIGAAALGGVTAQRMVGPPLPGGARRAARRPRRGAGVRLAQRGPHLLGRRRGRGRAARRGGRPGHRAADGDLLARLDAAVRCLALPAARAGRARVSASRGPIALGRRGRRQTAPQARLVFYDQRSHGESTRAPEGHSTMEYLASDLRQHDRHRGAGRPGRAGRALDGRDGDHHPGRAPTRNSSPSGSPVSG